MAGIVVVFDFDKTIIDCDSDNWIVDELGLSQSFKQLLPTVPFNSLMDRMMMELHSKGKTIEEIAECLRKVPLPSNIVSAIKSAHSFGCDLRILSDANVFFIETILEHHGLLDCFSEINTNPSLVDEGGRLRIFPYYDFKASCHGCKICPPNMCKGLVMEKIRSSLPARGTKRFIYLGDGGADFCAGLKLEEKDYLMPRKNFPLWEIIRSKPELVKAEVQEWCDGAEFQRTLLHLINKISIEENCRVESDQLVATDCKSHTSSVPTLEHFQSALPVPY
ncbi:thiamine phosphate phosphatase-like protein [Cornus florida]|uniref:thiamine phosphate phosphatase-like protein n=1 Tax=Cornus florida TaxID=4283 RepID=UPI0028973255|nr:thiamine phosphate phosphatase-like protein [Cornus florida]